MKFKELFKEYNGPMEDTWETFDWGSYGVDRISIEGSLPVANKIFKTHWFVKGLLYDNFGKK